MVSYHAKLTHNTVTFCSESMCCKLSSKYETLEPSNQSVRSANPSLLSVTMISLPSVQTFYIVIVLLFLRKLSHISIFNTTVGVAIESHSLSSSCVSDPVFSFHSI